MRLIVEGVRSFREKCFKQNEELFKTLAHGQTPRYLFITCSDSRIVPNMLTGLGPGDLFAMRNVGNIVPPPGGAPSGEVATIEYAVMVLKVKHIIVCGHSHCGAMTSLFEPDRLEKLPAVADFLVHADPVRRIIRTRYPRLLGEDRVIQAVKENVLIQLNHLRNIGSVSAALRRGDLQIHGWVYLMDEGDVLYYDTAFRQFRPVDECPVELSRS
jgi:carbonic anhydrase